MIIPWPLILRVGGPLVLLAAAWWGIATVLDSREHRGFALGQADVQRRWDGETAQRAREALRALVDAAAKKEAERLAKKEADDEQAKILAARDDALRGARSERDRLRADVAALNAAASGGPVPEAGCACCGSDAAAARAREVLERCAERREDVARDASDLAGQLIGLQAWAARAQAVCGPLVSAGPALVGAE